MGILSEVICKFLKATPFPSEALDNLADAMQINKISKKSKLERYYNVGFLQVGGMAFLDRVFFDSKYLEILLPDELQAVAAHEFTHLKKRHGIKKFFRLTVPMATVGIVIGLFVFSNFTFMDQIPLVGNLGKVVVSLLAALSFGFATLIGAFHANAKWLRQQETICDLSAVEYLNGESMVTAVIKLNNLRPIRNTRVERLLPKIYPSIEQRIDDIRVAAENIKKLNS